MKKIISTVVIITAFISGIAFAQTNVVSSANVVGYNQITIPSNQYVLISLDFNNVSNTVDGLFGNLPSGTKIYFWNTGSQSYNGISKGRAGWGDAGTNKFEIGTGAFVALPADTQTNIYFSGDVPMSGTTSVYTVNGYTFMAYPYPVDTAFTNTVLAKNAAVGDRISLWSNGWTTYSKGRAGWAAEATNLTIKVGQAFFYQSSTNAVVNELKPYTID